MQVLSKSLKIKISLSIIWVITTLLLLGALSNDSLSSFNFALFLGLSVACNLPLLIYWLGFWIWGDRYIFKTIWWLLKFLINKKTVGTILAFLAASATLGIMRWIGTVLQEGYFCCNRLLSYLDANILALLEGIGNIFPLIVMVWIGTKVYNWHVQPKNKQVMAVTEAEKEAESARRDVEQVQLNNYIEEIRKKDKTPEKKK